MMIAITTSYSMSLKCFLFYLRIVIVSPFLNLPVILFRNKHEITYPIALARIIQNKDSRILNDPGNFLLCRSILFEYPGNFVCRHHQQRSLSLLFAFFSSQLIYLLSLLIARFAYIQKQCVFGGQC